MIVRLSELVQPGSFISVHTVHTLHCPSLVSLSHPSWQRAGSGEPAPLVLSGVGLMNFDQTDSEPHAQNVRSPESP